MASNALRREDCAYTKCYCEENVWHLCKRSLSESKGEAFAVFISNPSRLVALFRQRAGDPDSDGVVVRDYHVIFVKVDADGNAFVFDLDTTLPFPVSLDTYITEALRKEERLRPEFRRLFRVIEGKAFVATFASNRSHMQREDGSWSSPPPKCDPICTQENDNNIQDFIDMSSKEWLRNCTQSDAVRELFPGNKYITIASKNHVDVHCSGFKMNFNLA